MKANHIPATERIRNRIWKLQARYDDGIGKKKYNPYNYCKGCGLHSPTISVHGHLKNCYMKGLQNELLYYKRLLWGLEHNNDYTNFYCENDHIL